MDPVGISATRFATIITARRFFVTVPKHLAAAKWTFLLDFVCMFATKPALAEQLDLVARHWTLVAVFREAGVAAFGIHAAVRAKRSALAMDRVQTSLRTRVGRNPNNHTACCATFEPLAPRSIKACKGSWQWLRTFVVIKIGAGNEFSCCVDGRPCVV
jgi:SH3-like domain-containing protein